jgi:hypothetical protein
MKFLNEIIYSHGRVKISTHHDSNNFLLQCKYLSAVRILSRISEIKIPWNNFDQLFYMALTLWEKQKMLRKMSAYTRKEISGQFRILHNEELHNLYR